MKQYAPEHIVRKFEITCLMLFLVTHVEKVALFSTIIAKHSITWLKTFFFQYLQKLQYRCAMAAITIDLSNQNISQHQLEAAN